MSATEPLAIYVVNGEWYSAFDAGPSWMVRWYRRDLHNGEFVESLQGKPSHPTTPEEAIQMAIERGSWA